MQKRQLTGQKEHLEKEMFPLSLVSSRETSDLKCARWFGIQGTVWSMTAFLKTPYLIFFFNGLYFLEQFFSFMEIPDPFHDEF